MKFPIDYSARLLSISDRLTDRRVPVIFSLIHLAHATAVDWAQLRAFIKRKGNFYQVFEIKKRTGGSRRICVPEPALKRVQTWIHANILCSQGALALLHRASSAYAPGASIVKNAEQHTGATWIVKLDIKDFFESISERQIYWVFRELGYSALLSFEMARITTRVIPRRKDGTRRHRETMWRWTNSTDQNYSIYRFVRALGHLPQGAPTSAILANLAVRKLDLQIQTIAERHSATYTRYADDIVLTLRDGSRSQCADIYRCVAAAITHAGFRINNRKSRISGPGSRKVVTGLVVTQDGPRLPKRYRESIKLALYHIKKHGLLSHAERCGHKDPLGYLNHLHGQIHFARAVEHEFGQWALEELHAAMNCHLNLSLVPSFHRTSRIPSLKLGEKPIDKGATKRQKVLTFGTFKPRMRAKASRGRMRP